MLKRIFQSGLCWLWLAIVVIAIDRYTKYWMTHHLVLGEPLEVLSIFNLTLAYNTGAAFSFLHSASGWQNWLLGGFAALVSVMILVALYRSRATEYWYNIALCFILGGALGNAWDRALYGYVIDFLNFHLGHWHFAIFNIADSAISVGAFMLLFYWMRQGKTKS